jgi:hypothetical protein
VDADPEGSFTFALPRVAVEPGEQRRHSVLIDRGWSVIAPFLSVGKELDVSIV